MKLTDKHMTKNTPEAQQLLVAQGYRPFTSRTFTEEYCYLTVDADGTILGLPEYDPGLVELYCYDPEYDPYLVELHCYEGDFHEQPKKDRK
jgi:hypothetical protein